MQLPGPLRLRLPAYRVMPGGIRIRWSSRRVLSVGAGASSRITLATLVWLSLGSCFQPSERVAASRSDFELFAVGADSGAVGLGTLMKPLDAVFLDDGGMAVLDASAPWIRIYDHRGRFLRAIVHEGEGPGEITRPLALATDGHGALLLSHPRGVLGLEPGGRTAWSSPRFRASGAVGACGAVFALNENAGLPPSASIVRLGPDGFPGDTVVALTPIRRHSRTYHPWFVHGDSARLAFYSEEVEQDRIIEYDCRGGQSHTISVDSLGHGMLVEMTSDGTNFRTRTAAPSPPHPAGLAWIGGRGLWASRHILATGDSVTVFSSHPSEGERSLAVEGWYQLYDGGEQGRILLGNSWTDGQRWNRGASWEGIPLVLVWDGLALLSAIRFSD